MPPLLFPLSVVLLASLLALAAGWLLAPRFGRWLSSLRWFLIGHRCFTRSETLGTWLAIAAVDKKNETEKTSEDLHA